MWKFIIWYTLMAISVIGTMCMLYIASFLFLPGIVSCVITYEIANAEFKEYYK